MNNQRETPKNCLNPSFHKDMGGYFTPFLNLQSIVSLSKTCKNIYNLLNRPPVWQDLLARFFTQPRETYPVEFQNAPKLLFRTLQAEKKLQEKKEAFRKTMEWKSDGFYRH